MHEGSPLAIHLGAASVAVRPAVADAQYKVAGQHGCVAIPVAGLQAHHARHQRMVVGDRAPAHQGGNDRHARQLGKFHQQAGCVCIDDAATCHDERLLGCHQHVQCTFNLFAGRRRLVDGQRFVGVDVEFNFAHLHVERQINQHGPWTAAAHQVKRLLERAGHQRRLAHGDAPLGDRLADGLDVHRLKVFLVQPCPWRLARDTQNRDAVGNGRIQPGNHIGAGRATGADAHTDVARLGAGVALGHV